MGFFSAALFLRSQEIPPSTPVMTLPLIWSFVYKAHLSKHDVFTLKKHCLSVFTSSLMTGKEMDK